MKKTSTVLTGDLKQEFQKDLELFKHFLLLLNDTSPIRNVELMWHEEDEELDPSKEKFRSRVGTGDALVQLQPAGAQGANRNSPSTLFCDLVHGFGSHEETTCARSDVPAKQRCRLTGCTQVYNCHVGLTDIAVPVTCDGEYLGTLFSGQVLTSHPTAQGFRFVRESLAGQEHINFSSLKDAYYRVPVVSQAQVAETVRILELFARYISNSWKRLQLISESQRKQDRELSLDRKELAAILLSGEIGDLQELKQLTRRTGLQRIPDRVLVLQIEYLESSALSRSMPSPTLNRLSHVVEDLCQTLPNSLATVVRPGEVCIFTSQEVRNPSHERLTLHDIAENILGKVRSQTNASIRIGISEEHRQPRELLNAYHEACAALDTGGSTVSFFSDPAPQKMQLSDLLTQLLKAFRQGSSASRVLGEFLARALPADHSVSEVQQSRALLTWAIEHLALETMSAGIDPAEVKAAKEKATAGVLHAPSPFAACEAFRRFAEIISQQTASAFTERHHHKIVLAVSRVVEQRGAAQISIHDLANAVHLSCGHLSRVFRKTTGTTLEQYLIQQRVALAKRALLDPRLNVAEVAERCGFCNPAYFASVFKKYVKCTPREFANQPQRWDSSLTSSSWPMVMPDPDHGDAESQRSA